MVFEYDPDKSAANLSKHGIDFVEARALWEDDNRLEIPAGAMDESRFIVIGMIDNKHWSAVLTYRGENIRLISVRRSRQKEIAYYESL